MYHSETSFQEESQQSQQFQFSEEIEDRTDYDLSSCIPTEPYVPIRNYVYEQNNHFYQKCDELTTEWRLELVDWAYHEHHDQTEYKYSICTSHIKPFNHCKVSEDEMSQTLKGIALQMPCDCEVCVGFAVHSMEPNGKFAQV